MRPGYAPFYCEENAWQLCRALVGRPRELVFVSNAEHKVALFAQRAGREPDGLIVWDYHAVLAVKNAGRGRHERPAGVGGRGRDWRICDPDCRLGQNLAASDWLDASFPFGDAMPEPYRPRFRVVEGDRFLEVFATDRSHMRDAQGDWIKPPPSWDPPGEGMNLMRFLDMEQPFEGEVLDLDALRARYRSG